MYMYEVLPTYMYKVWQPVWHRGDIIGLRDQQRSSCAEMHFRQRISRALATSPSIIDGHTEHHDLGCPWLSQQSALCCVDQPMPEGELVSALTPANHEPWQYYYNFIMMMMIINYQKIIMMRMIINYYIIIIIGSWVALTASQH